jgi:pyruvate dehydrogenase E1 component beta subunit
MADLTFSAAINAALTHAMAADERIVVFGEDVRLMRRDLYLRFGGRRVRNTPISESAMLGTALGAAMAGLRPVVEIMFVDFVPVAMDMLVNHVAKLVTFSAGTWEAPLVIRAACGGGYGDAGQHEQVLWGMLAGVPGLAVVAPATPADAAGLLLGALDHAGPVVFLEHKLLSREWLDVVGGSPAAVRLLEVPAAGTVGPVRLPPAPVPLGRAALRRPGRDLVIVTVGVGVHVALEASRMLAEDGVQTAVLDLRSVAPLDVHAVLEQAERTGNVLVVDEDYSRGGLSGEIAALVAENDVRARFARVTCEGTIPYARSLEHRVLPNVERVLDATRWLLGEDIVEVR